MGSAEQRRAGLASSAQSLEMRGRGWGFQAEGGARGRRPGSKARLPGPEPGLLGLSSRPL